METYLDASELTANQTLVVMDEAGKRYNVENMLSASRSWRRGHAATDAKKEVILERWRVELTYVFYLPLESSQKSILIGCL